MNGKTHRGRRMAVVLSIAVAIPAGATGCGGGDKAGGSGGPVTLRIGTDDQSGRPSGDAIEEFARQAAKLSGGKIRIEPVYKAGGLNRPAWDQHIAHMVSRGELDMGMIPARAWDTEGVTSLRALHAPFLVDSEQLMERIAKSRLADQMLGGLGRAGVVGLALLPEELRHPFGFRRPLRSLGDFGGQTVRTPRSEVAYSIVRRLGATPEELPGDAFGQAVAKGSVAGVDSGFEVAVSVLPRKAIAAANVTLYPKVNSLVMNRKVWKGLSGGQRETLRSAARRTLGGLLESKIPEREAAQRYCARGGRVVLAKKADLAAMIEAVQPVYTELDRDAPTKALIGRIRELKRGLPSSPHGAPTACRAATSRPAAAGGGDEDAFPQGVYRADVSPAFLREQGIDAATANDNSGLMTMTFKDGRWRHQMNSPQNPPDCGGTYSAKAGRVSILADPGPECGTAAGGVLFSATWTLRHSELRLAHVRSGEGQDLFAQALWGGKPWRKIG